MFLSGLQQLESQGSDKSAHADLGQVIWKKGIGIWV